MGLFSSFEVDLRVLQAIIEKLAEPNGPDVHEIVVSAEQLANAEDFSQLPFDSKLRSGGGEWWRRRGGTGRGTRC